MYFKVIEKTDRVKVKTTKGDAVKIHVPVKSNVCKKGLFSSQGTKNKEIPYCISSNPF